jgi:hypothetical protein
MMNGKSCTPEAATNGFELLMRQLQPWGTKRENHLSRSRALRGKEDEARRKQTNERFHALNLRLESEPRIRF